MSAVVVQMPPHVTESDPQNIPDRAEYIERLREILTALEADDPALFESRLGHLMRLRDNGLFVNLAKLTRELHEAVRDLNFDDRLKQIAGNEIPDACKRLDYVAKLGEDAAHRTLDLVDNSRRLVDSLSECTQGLASARERVLQDGNTLAWRSSLAGEVEATESKIKQVSGQLRAHFSEISQAQEYQDLSGQVIRRVTTLVHNIEGALIKLLRATNDGLKNPTAAPIQTQPGELAGPAVPGLSESASQQDADALLAELGF